MIENFPGKTSWIEIPISPTAGFPSLPTPIGDGEPASDLFADLRVATLESETQTAVFGASKPLLSTISKV